MDKDFPKEEEVKEAIDEQEAANMEKEVKIDPADAAAGNEDGLDTPKHKEEQVIDNGNFKEGKVDPKLVELQMELDNNKKISDGHKAEIERLTKQLTVKLEALEDPDQYIPKKTAALEVYREVIALKNTYIYSIIFILLVAATSAYIIFIGAIISGIIAMAFSVMMFRKLQKMKYLEGKYQLIRPKLFKKAE